MRNKVVFEMHLTEHCNLNCCGCIHFSPLAEPEFTSLEEFTRDVRRMAEIFSHECEWIHLMGGEPLLHPDVNSFLRVTRREFPRGKIELVTNGTLLMNQSAEFWRTCRECSIIVSISYYPINLDIQGIRQRAEEFGVHVQYYGAGKRLDDFIKFTTDPSGSQNMRSNFAHCPYSNSCIFLRHGRLYTCSFAGNVHHFNRVFNKNILITERDYIDIYKENNPDAILKKLSEPMPICRYCVPEKRELVSWHISKREISEWV